MSSEREEKKEVAFDNAYMKQDLEVRGEIRNKHGRPYAEGMRGLPHRGSTTVSFGGRLTANAPDVGPQYLISGGKETSAVNSSAGNDNWFVTPETYNQVRVSWKMLDWDPSTYYEITLYVGSSSIVTVPVTGPLGSFPTCLVAIGFEVLVSVAVQTALKGIGPIQSGGNTMVWLELDSKPGIEPQLEAEAGGFS